LPIKLWKLATRWSSTSDAAFLLLHRLGFERLCHRRYAGCLRILFPATNPVFSVFFDDEFDVVGFEEEICEAMAWCIASECTIATLGEESCVSGNGFMGARFFGMAIVKIATGVFVGVH